MILRLLMFVLGWMLAFAVPGGLVAYGAWQALRPWRKERRRLKDAAGRANRLLGAHNVVHGCFECLGEVDADQDCYLPTIGWFHQRCMKNVIK